MDKIFNADTQQGFRLRDSRAALAAMAMLLSGLLLSLLVQQYFAAHDADQPITRSRMWWELILNLQILSIGMMWFSYSDTIPDTPGPLRRTQIIRRWLAVVGVATPALLVLSSVVLHRYNIVPGIEVLSFFSVFAASYFAIMISLRRRAERIFRPLNRAKYSLAALLAYSVPLQLLAFVLVFDFSQGSWLCLIAAPTLLYLQAAMPYILHAIGNKEFPLFEQV